MIQILKKHFNNKKVLITGHTGFKGSWLTSWMLKLGANVHGISLGTPSKLNHFNYIKNNKNLKNYNINIQNYSKIALIINKIKPDYVFHLAAQSIVLRSYTDPRNTFLTNTIGTINLLESLRHLKKKCSVVIITSDKCYENYELKRGYNETDKLGGSDPYSASKGSAEIAFKSFYSSFFINNKYISLATARTGNVIGGGDWAINRIVPDCINSWSLSKTVFLRNPMSTRPWQHVLEPLSGYIILSIKLKKDLKINGESFNFGPSNLKPKSVQDLVSTMSKSWKKTSWKINKNYRS